MELTLRFRGELPAFKPGRARLKEKQAIRVALHNQLCLVWKDDVRLKQVNIRALQQPHRDGKHFEVNRPIVGHENFYWRYPLGGYNFVPLATYVHELHCHLSIRLYRRMDIGGIVFDGGDLDGRLKLLFDGLRVPHSASELPVNMRSPKGESSTWPHFFCLLDDDRTITKLTIESFKLLTPIPDCEHPENYAEVDIDVSLTPASAISGNIDMLFP